MTINFEQFTLYKGIGRQEKELLDVKKIFADEIYNHGQGIACHALALKIYNSQGTTEYSDDEFRLMVAFAEQCMTPSFIDSLKMCETDGVLTT